MAKYVLAADYTLMTDYRNVPLATFFSCIPTDYWQSRLVFRILADQPKLDAQGRPIRVPYGLRKVEASLVRAFGRDDVVIADPRDGDRQLDRSDGRPDPEELGPDDARDERGHARVRPRLRVLRSHPAPAAILPVRLHRRRDRGEHEDRPIVDPAPLGRYLPVQPRELEDDGAE